MNLFHEPSMADLRNLVESGDNKLLVHNIVVDYDGEVIIDPEYKYSDIGLNRYKYHTQISTWSKTDIRNMANLLENLVKGFDTSVRQIYRDGGDRRSAA